MPNLYFNTSFKKGKLSLSATDIKERYFLGIKTEDREGNPLKDRVIESYIKDAQTQIENFLNLKLLPQIMLENGDYKIENFLNWGYIPTSYPVVKVHSFQGLINNVQQFRFDREWFSVKKNTDNTSFQRAAHLVPGRGAYSYSGMVISGASLYYGWLGNRHIPNYWEITYCTGFPDGVPADILNAIGKLASINIFNILGDIVLGAGIASQSISIDNLSESIQTTQSAENSAYSARIRMYMAELKTQLPLLKGKYDQPVIVDC